MMNSPMVTLELWHGAVAHTFRLEKDECFSRAFHTTASMYKTPVRYVYNDYVNVDQDDTPNKIDKTASTITLRALKTDTGYAKPSPVSVLINSSYIHRRSSPSNSSKRPVEPLKRPNVRYTKMRLADAIGVLRGNASLGNE